MARYRANADIFEMKDKDLKIILEKMVDGDTNFNLVKNMISNSRYILPNKMLEPNHFADGYAASMQEIYNSTKGDDSFGYPEWYQIYTDNRDIGYQIATTINGYLIWLMDKGRRY